jgi:hypothetical protein
MKTVFCYNCKSFIDDKYFPHDDNLLAKPIEKAKCLKGKQLKFYSPETMIDETWGYKRKCSEIEKEATK